MRTRPAPHAQSGASMIEVLVTIIILTFGLMGLAGLQSRLQVSEFEAYQRAQALILLEDMANRISANRTDAANYVTTTPLGTGATDCTSAPSSGATRKAQDCYEWSEAIRGASELRSEDDDTKIGAMVGGRGCINGLGNGEYLITVAWQGMGPLSAPPASVACGKDSYNHGSVCTNDRCRRALTTIVRIADLTL